MSASQEKRGRFLFLPFSAPFRRDDGKGANRWPKGSDPFFFVGMRATAGAV
jgi:hypothetical protein